MIGFHSLITNYAHWSIQFRLVFLLCDSECMCLLLLDYPMKHSKLPLDSVKNRFTMSDASEQKVATFANGSSSKGDKYLHDSLEMLEEKPFTVSPLLRRRLWSTSLSSLYMYSLLVCVAMYSSDAKRVQCAL